MMPLRVETTPILLTLEWPDGGRQELPAEWLLDNAPEHRDPHSGQRLIDIADLPARPRIRAAHLEVEKGLVRLEWDESLPPTRLSARWLHDQLAERRDSPQLWLEGAALDLKRDFALASLEALRQDERRRLAWLERLIAQGLALIEHVPTDDGGLLEAMRWVGQVQPTNYGVTFEVRTVPEPENLAYSDLGLGLHTDNPYREPVPGYQALHALVVAPEGGDSLFADGFALAEQLHIEEPATFETLTHTRVPFHYRSKDAELAAERPLIALDCMGEVCAVHYNSRSIAPLRLAPPAMLRFYGAYRRFAERLRDARLSLRYRLRAGEIVVFDNRRILHGRTAFPSARHARHLRGCYLTRDSVRSNAALLARELGQRSIAMEAS
jgi:gamma-butyrobetaine dioxygenase